VPSGSPSLFFFLLPFVITAGQLELVASVVAMPVSVVKRHRSVGFALVADRDLSATPHLPPAPDSWYRFLLRVFDALRSVLIYDGVHAALARSSTSCSGPPAGRPFAMLAQRRLLTADRPVFAAQGFAVVFFLPARRRSSPYATHQPLCTGRPTETLTLRSGLLAVAAASDDPQASIALGLEGLIQHSTTMLIGTRARSVFSFNLPSHREAR